MNTTNDLEQPLNSDEVRGSTSRKSFEVQENPFFLKKVALLHLLLYTASFPTSVLVLFNSSKPAAVNYVFDQMKDHYGSKVFYCFEVVAMSISVWVLPGFYMNTRQSSHCFQGNMSTISKHLFDVRDMIPSLWHAESFFCSPWMFLLMPAAILVAFLAFHASYAIDHWYVWGTGSVSGSWGLKARLFAKRVVPTLAGVQFRDLKYHKRTRVYWYILALWFALLMQFAFLALLSHSAVTLVVGYACGVLLRQVSVMVLTPPAHIVQLIDGIMGLHGNSTLGVLIMRLISNSSTEVYLTAAEKKEIEKIQELDELVRFLDQVVHSDQPVDLKDWPLLSEINEARTWGRDNRGLIHLYNGVWHIGSLSLQSWTSMIVRTVLLVDEECVISTMDDEFQAMVRAHKASRVTRYIS